MINLFFILVYAMFTNILSGQAMLIIFSIHCMIVFAPNLRQKKLIATPIALYIIGVMIVNIADYGLISSLHNGTEVTYAYAVAQYLDTSVQIWCISSTSIFIGYDLASKWSFPHVFYMVKSKSSLKKIFYALFAIDILQFIGVRLFTISQIAIFLDTAGLIGILVFARIYGKTQERRFLIFTVILAIVQTYFALLHAYLRLSLIVPTFLMFLGYFIGKEDFKYLFTYRVIPFLFAFGLFALAFKTLGASRSNFLEAFKYGQFAAENEVDASGQNALLDRSSNLAQISCVVDLVNKNGFYKGAASSPLLIALVPRFLWKDKPSIALGRWFALESGHAYMNDAGVINNSINMTIGGEFYLDFGWPGVVIGSLLFGVFFAMMWNATQFYASEYNMLGIMFGGYLLYISFINFGADLEIIITILSFYFSFFVVRKILDLL